MPPGFRNAFAPINFAGATVNEVDECVDVTDSMAGALGTACAADAPKTFTYTKTVENTASFVSKDSGATASASASVAVSVKALTVALEAYNKQVHPGRRPR